MPQLSALRLRRLMTGAATTAIVLSPAFAAMAQDQTPALQQQTSDAAEVEEIIITGSRIARDPNSISSVPVMSMGADEIRKSGEADIGEILNDIPALLTSNTSTNSIGGVFGSGSGESAGASVGETILQLRGMGIERTLVLVDGRRHVAGVPGSQAVDVGTIPRALIERVEVLTGGASAIYGADAVTGVVNFVLKDDFEGLELDVNGGISEQGDGEFFTISGVYGMNFADDRGNFALAVDYTQREDLRAGDRAFSRNNGIADDLPNPALRFQAGDISSDATPNFARLFQPGTSFASSVSPCDRFGFNFCFGMFDRGLTIPDEDRFLALWQDAFPNDPLPSLTAAERALIDRAQNAPTRLIAKNPNFSISSAGGIILPGGGGSPFNTFLTGIDLDGNSTDDCLQSFVGFSATIEFSPPALGAVGGCWIIQEDGAVRPIRDGLISGEFNQFGDDGIPNTFDEDFLTPDQNNININFLTDYELTDGVTFFLEGKYVRQRTLSGGPLNTFWDLLTIAPDNAFLDDLPAELAALGRSEGLFITRDPADLGPNINKNIRETYRLVAGVDGEMDNGWEYSISGNYGKFEVKDLDRNRVIVDRFFAAIDSVIDPDTGEAICRSDIDATPPPTTPFNIPAFQPGFFTFNPGDGSCAPANILGGRGAISQEAIDFITTTVENNFEVEQAVFNAVLSGDTAEFFEAPAGPVGFAFGTEFRSERSSSRFDPLVRGELPVDAPGGNEGDLVADIFEGNPDGQRSLVFDPGSLTRNVAGNFDVIEFFAEVSVPLIRGAFLAEELTVDAAFRFSDYSTVGSTLTWKAGGTYAPIQDIRFRGTYSVAVRAPNVTELFSPAQGAFFRPIDPCDQGEIDALIEAGDARGPIREANCREAGIPEGFVDPLSARFVGETAGNPDLIEETARTATVGAVVQPRFLPGLTLSGDFWRISIEDAISAPSAQDIVDGCFDSLQFPDNQFCDLFRRNEDPTSPQFNGFSFLRQQQLNIGALISSGIDVTARYSFDIDEYRIDLSLSGTKVRRLDTFFDPSNPDANDPELGELQRPEWAGNLGAVISRGPVSVTWQSQYLGKQGLRSVEIETVDQIFGPAGITGSLFIHDISFTYDVMDNLQVYGGVNNLGDKDPFITEAAFPVSPVGRNFFLGATFTY